MGEEQQQQFQDIEAKEVRGVTPKFLIWLIGGIITLEFTMLGTFFSLKQELQQNTKDNAANKDEIYKLRVDVDALEKHQIKQDDDIYYLRHRNDNHIDKPSD